MAFSKEVGKKTEVCEAVGENWTAEKMESFSIKSGFYQKGSRTFRVVNPFIPQSFEPYAASLMLEFFCTKTFFEIKPARGHWRKIFGFDSFELKLEIENYLLVPYEKKNEFEELISKKITRNFEVKDKNEYYKKQ